MDINKEPSLLQLHLEGMSCQSCERRIRSGLMKLPGISKVDVNYQDGIAEISYNPAQSTQEVIVSVINKLGYIVKDNIQKKYRNESATESKLTSDPESLEKQNSGDDSSVKITIPVAGMHCKSCELLIEDQFLKQKGVLKASASFNDSSLTIILEKGSSLGNELIDKLLKEVGYSKGKEKTKIPMVSKNPEDYKDLLIALIILFVSYLILQISGLGNLTPNSSGKSFSLPVIALIGLTAGFSTCMALVGGLVLGISARICEANPNATPGEKFRPHLFFCSGRIVSYIVLGGFLGLLGSIFQFSSVSLGILTIIIGFVMLIMGIQLIDIFPWSNRIKLTLPKVISRKIGVTSGKIKTIGNSFVLGALTFLLPCGFTQAMQVYAIGTGNFIDGALTMGAFVLGTIPGLLGIGGFTSIVKGVFARRFFKFAGLVVILFAYFNISNGIGLSGLSIPFTNKSNSTDNDPHVTLENGMQVVRMKESEEGYSPKAVTIRNDIPVKWIISAEAPLSCAASLIVPKYDIRKTLLSGENKIEFTPNAPGVVKFTCSMGMHTGYFRVIDPNSGTQHSETDTHIEKNDNSKETKTKYSLARVSDSLQYVESAVSSSGYQPIVVQKGLPVEWIITADSSVLNGCNNRIIIPDLKIEQKLKAGNTVIRFTATDTGDIELTCWMNMIKSTITVVEKVGPVDSK